MKKYILIASVIFLAGCTKQLNQTPQSTASVSAIFGTTGGLQLYATSFYDNLPGISDVYKTDAGMSDLGTQSSPPSFLLAGAYTSRQSSGWSFTALRNINYFIANNTNPAIPVATRNNYNGLARFFRAYFYYNMVVRFGDVPWVSTPLSVTDSTLYAARTPRAVVMDSILADLDYAIANISMTTDPTASQITRWVAYGLKSRVCLFEGTFRKYRGGQTSDYQPWLQEAATAAKAVIDSGRFALNQSGGVTQSYRQLFISAAPIASEVMLSNVASSSLAVFNDANWYFTSATYGVRFSYTRRFINTYLNLDGTPFTSTPGYDTVTFVNEVKNRDTRLQQTIRTPGYNRINSGNSVAAPPVFSYTYTGYQPIKWCLDDVYYDNGANNTNSISLMRYAEILLNYAEAEAELGQMTASIWSSTIGALRARAGITGGLTTVPTTADPYMEAYFQNTVTDPVILEVRRERGTELNLEGLRYNDLIRWQQGLLLTLPWNGFYVPSLNTLMDLNADGVPDVCFYQGSAPSTVAGVTYVNVSSTLNGGPNPQILSQGDHGELHWLDNVSRTFDTTYMYLYPIPYSELQLNPNLQQNPKWQ